MIEVKIPKELDQYEAKFVGSLTLRQTVCVLCAFPVGIFLFNLTKPYVGVDTAGFLCLIPAVVAYLFGWKKPYGMKFEVFLRSVFITTVLAPSKRKYKTENYFKTLMLEAFEDEDDDFSVDGNAKNKKKKNKKGKSSSGKSNYKPSDKAIF